MNRDMYYQNLNQGYQNPGMIIPPSGYNLNTNYQAYGPNVMPNNMPYQNNNYNGANYNNGYNNGYNDIYDRFDKIDKQIKNLDSRLQKLESTTNSVNDNVYMI